MLIGSQGGVKIDADDIACIAGTISYSVLCGIQARVRRGVHLTRSRKVKIRLLTRGWNDRLSSAGCSPNVQIADVERVVFDELAAALHVLAHQRR